MSIKRTIITTIVALAVVAVVAPGVAIGTTIDDLLAQIAQLQAQLVALQSGSSTTTAGTGACAGVTFTRNLTVGSTGSDVKCLQQILNQSATTKVATTGAGSPGAETTYFGSRTLAAVKVYQAEHGWTPANQVGPMTRSALNASLGTTGGTTGGTVTPTGSISAALAADNPASGALINNQASANLLSVNFTGTGTVTSVTLQRTGISNQNTLSNIYLFDGNIRITDGYSFNINGQTVMSGLSIAVNGSKTISVRADVSSTATLDSSSVAAALTGYTGNGSAMSANLQGNMFTIVTGSAASVYLAANTMTATATINAGTSQYTFWTNSVQVNTRAVLLKTANFRMVGSAPSDALASIKLFVDGVDTGKVATIGTITGSNYAIFDLTLSPITLTTGTHTIDLRADVQKGTNRTIQLSVQQASDLTVTDPQIGVNIAVLGAGGNAFTANSGTTFTISWGTTVTTIDPTFTSQTNITSGATNAVIGKFRIHAYGEDVKVSSIQVTPLIKSAVATNCSTDASGTTVTSACGLNNVTLYFNGSQVSSSSSWTHALMAAATPITYILGSQMIVLAGQDSTIEVRADLQTAAGASYTSGTILVTLEGDTDNAYGQSSQYTVGVPQTSDVATTGLAISSASLVVSKNTGLADYTVSPHTQNVRIGSFIAQNQSSSEAVRLTQLTVNLTTDGTTAMTDSTTPALTNFSALRTSDTTGSGATPIQPTATNTFSVTDVLQPGASMTIDIFANTSSATSGSIYTRLTVASIGVTSNIASTGTITTGQAVSLGVGIITNPPTKVTSTSSVAQYVAAAGGASKAGQVTFNFLSTGAASTITELKFTVSGTDATPTGTVTAVCIGAVCSGPVSGVASFSGLSLVVPNVGGGLSQNVQVSYANVGTGGVASASTSTLGLYYVKYITGGTTKTLGTSVACTAAIGTTCTHTLSTTVNGNPITLVGSKPIVTLVAVPSTTKLVVGTQTVGYVKVKADTKGDIDLNALALTFTGNTATTIKPSTALVIKDRTGTTVSNAVTGNGSSNGGAAVTGNNSAAATAVVIFTDGYRINAGDEETFEVVVNIGALGASASGDSVALGLTRANTGTIVGNDVNGFAWTDVVGSGTTAAGTGTLITNFPTTTVSIGTN